MASQPHSLVTPSPMVQLLEQLALDDLPPTAPSDDSLDSSTKTLTEEPEPLLSSSAEVDFSSLLTSSRDSSLTAESASSSQRPSREGSCIIPAGPSQNSSNTSLHKPTGTPPPIPQTDPINNHARPLHLSTSSPTLRGGGSILRAPSDNGQSTPQLSDTSSPLSPPSPPTPSIKFAPLPEIERTKKRKHNQRLGVAARSQLLARRRQLMHESEDADQPPKQLWRSEKEEEDPLVALGHMVKLASIGIWRKVSLRDKKTRPPMQERSNSDSLLEMARPVAYAETGDEVLIELVEEDISSDNTSQPQTETVTYKSTDDKVVVVHAEVAPMPPISTTES